MVACSLFIIFFISIVLDYFDGKVTKKIVKCKRKARFSFHFRVPSKFDIVEVKKS